MAGYNQSRLIYLSLLQVAAINRGATPSTNQINDTTDILDDMIQGWQADGVRLWTLEDVTIPLVANQKTYTLGPTGNVTGVTQRPASIVGQRRHNIASNIDTPIVLYSNTDYNWLSNKNQTGTPIAIYYDKHYPNGTVYCYLVPDTAAAADYTLILTAQMPLTSVTYSTTTMQFPNPCFQALRWGLASELGPMYGVPPQQQQIIDQKAMFYKMKMEEYDQEDASIYFTLDRTGQFRT